MRVRVTSTILQRALSAIPTVVLAALVVFLLQRLIPGDPAQAIAGEYATPDRLNEIREQLGLNQPVVMQFADWVGNAVTGDLGQSLHSGQPVTDIVLERLPLTLLLTFGAIAIAVVIGLPTGIWAARKIDTNADRLLTTIATLGMAIPSFWLGMMLIIVFSLTLGWLPGPGGPLLSQNPIEALKGLLLPSFALGLVGAAEVSRQTRSAMIETLSSDYIRTHRAKGLTERQIVWRHALRNSAVPLATIVGIQIPRLIGGAVVVEAVFGLAGLGTLVVSATNQRDYTLVQGIVFIVSIIVVLTNLAVDIGYRLLDPRIRA